jgi:hypothetical protein
VGTAHILISFRNQSLDHLWDAEGIARRVFSGLRDVYGSVYREVSK